MRRTVLTAAIAALTWTACGDDGPTGLITSLRIEGSVSELGTGQPIENAAVILQFPQGTGLGSRTAFTNASGRYVVTFTSGAAFSDCRQFAISAQAPPEFEPAFENEIRCVPEQTIDFELRRAG